jgi:VIT1/CCC1 family predicted Fe2+/Mn2+ transporter
MGEAEAIVDRLAKEKELPLQVSALEELGLAPKELGNPVKAGVLCGVSFGLAASVPILPFALPIGIWEALIASVIGTVATLFGVGAMKTIFSRSLCCSNNLRYWNLLFHGNLRINFC